MGKVLDRKTGWYRDDPDEVVRWFERLHERLVGIEYRLRGPEHWPKGVELRGRDRGAKGIPGDRGQGEA